MSVAAQSVMSRWLRTAGEAQTRAWAWPLRRRRQALCRGGPKPPAPLLPSASRAAVAHATSVSHAPVAAGENAGMMQPGAGEDDGGGDPMQRSFKTLRRASLESCFMYAEGVAASGERQHCC